MSHNVEFYTYPVTKKQAAIENELQAYARRRTWEEGGGGLPSSIRWYNDVCDDYDSAHDFISNHDKGWYDQVAVKYRHFDKPLNSKKLDELKAQLRDTAQKLRELESKVAFKEFKAQYISCKNCGSKLNKDFIKRNNCVVCGYDMRSDTTKSTIARLAEKVKTLEKSVREEEKKLAQKKAKEAKEYWLVKIEYHT
jgi:ribosomal protein L37E